MVHVRISCPGWLNIALLHRNYWYIWQDGGSSSREKKSMGDIRGKQEVLEDPSFFRYPNASKERRTSNRMQLSRLDAPVTPGATWHRAMGALPIMKIGVVSFSREWNERHDLGRRTCLEKLFSIFSKEKRRGT
jgi:hypothetical protein